MTNLTLLILEYTVIILMKTDDFAEIYYGLYNTNNKIKATRRSLQLVHSYGFSLVLCLVFCTYTRVVLFPTILARVFTFAFRDFMIS